MDVIQRYLASGSQGLKSLRLGEIVGIYILAVAVQSFGDFQNFHPHLHILSTDGCFYDDDAFMVCPPPNTGDLASGS